MHGKSVAIEKQQIGTGNQLADETAKTSILFQ